MPAAVSDPIGPFEALLYGIIQGLTEFLPISSSGHLQIAHLLELGVLPEAEAQAFDVLLHAGTFFAIVIAFRRELFQLLRCPPRVWLCLGISIVPAGLAGLFAGDVVVGLRGSWWPLVATFAGTALLLAAAHGLQRRRSYEAPPGEGGSVSAEELLAVTPAQAALVGALQIFALLPGVSRSGSTLSAGLIGGMGPRLAVAWSFLVGLPLIGGAAAKDAVGGGFARLLQLCGPTALVIGFSVSLLVGLASVVLLKIVVLGRRLPYFAGYCALVAAGCLFMALQ